MSLDIVGRRILVTGASSGIGGATAGLLAERGAKVAGAARRLDQIASAGNVHPIHLDLSDQASAERAVTEAASALGGIDLLINAAGVARFGPVATADYGDWQEMFTVNVLGLLAITQAAVPHLRAGDHAQIINVSSMSGHRVLSSEASVYAGTKFAVQAISDGLRKELAPDRIRVATVSPSYVKDTGIHLGHTDPQTRRNAKLSSNATGIELADCAEIIAYIASTSADVQIQQVQVTSDNPPG